MGQKKVVWSGPFLIHGKPQVNKTEPANKREKARKTKRSTKMVFDPGDKNELRSKHMHRQLAN